MEYAVSHKRTILYQHENLFSYIVRVGNRLYYAYSKDAGSYNLLYTRDAKGTQNILRLLGDKPEVWHKVNK